MFHANTQRMIDYWTARAQAGRAPLRAAVDPGDFRELMSQAFILGRRDRGDYPLRLAGAFLPELHGRDLRGADGLCLWSERDRLRLQGALEEARHRVGPLLVMAEALTGGPSLSMEVLFLPLQASANGTERFLGLYQPLAMVSRLQGLAALELSVRALHRPGIVHAPAQPVRLATLHGRRIA
jgi:hypothetical protein